LILYLFYENLAKPDVDEVREMKKYDIQIYYIHYHFMSVFVINNWLIYVRFRLSDRITKNAAMCILRYHSLASSLLSL